MGKMGCRSVQWLFFLAISVTLVFFISNPVLAATAPKTIKIGITSSHRASGRGRGGVETRFYPGHGGMEC